MAEQRYQAVLAVISDGETVTEVAARFGVARQTVHDWLAKYEAGGLENLGDRSHRPRSCPHQMGSEVEVAIARMRPRIRAGVRGGSPSSWPERIWSSRCAERVGGLPGVGAVEPDRPEGRRRRDRKWKRWERGAPMELWQMDVVGGFVLADGTPGQGVDRGR